MGSLCRQNQLHSRGPGVGSRGHAAPSSAEAFTLVELLLSMTILSVLMLVVVNVIGVVQQQWTRANSRVTSFREARMAFDVITRNLSQATLNAYWTTKNNPVGLDPAAQPLIQTEAYVRQSELEFVCGQTSGLLPQAAGSPGLYPGHAVFFQAPLGTTRLVAGTSAQAGTENMVNLLCGRGYFVAWGDDAAFRPPFLAAVQSVRPRFRYRLMEYSPTAESNRIYFDPTSAASLATRRPITDPGMARSWFKDEAIVKMAVADEALATRAFTRPVADNIIVLVISPQNEQSPQVNTPPEVIAPLYEYDSALTSNPGAPNAGPDSQGTQHLLPPLLKLTMVSLDSAAGERLAEGGNAEQQAQLGSVLAPLFRTATGYNTPNSVYRRDLQTLESFLVSQRLNYRIFTTTVLMKQARWSH